jgi:hypothetical protein
MQGGGRVRVLIVVTREIKLEPNDLSMYLNADIRKNTNPDQGIAIYEAGKEIDWSWPDITIKVGEVDTGRHNIDLTIAKSEDVVGAIVEYLMALEEGSVISGE